MAAPNPQSIQSPAVTLSAPKFDLYTQAELAEYSGADGGKIYVAIKGTHLASTNGHLWLTMIAH